MDCGSGTSRMKQVECGKWKVESGRCGVQLLGSVLFEISEMFYKTFASYNLVD